LIENIIQLVENNSRINALYRFTRMIPEFLLIEFNFLISNLISSLKKNTPDSPFLNPVSQFLTVSKSKQKDDQFSFVEFVLYRNEMQNIIQL